MKDAKRGESIKLSRRKNPGSWSTNSQIVLHW